MRGFREDTMKAAIEQLSNDTTIVYLSLHFLEAFPKEDPLRPEVMQLLAAGNAALSEHLVELRAQVKKHRSQCLRTPYARVKTNYLRTPAPLFLLGKESVHLMSTRELVLFMIDELQSNIQNPQNYTDCHTFDQGVLFRLRQLYQMTAPVRRNGN
jgi:hypothetical protein